MSSPAQPTSHHPRQSSPDKSYWICCRIIQSQNQAGQVTQTRVCPLALSIISLALLNISSATHITPLLRLLVQSVNMLYVFNVPIFLEANFSSSSQRPCLLEVLRLFWKGELWVNGDAMEASLRSLHLPSTFAFNLVDQWFSRVHNCWELMLGFLLLGFDPSIVSWCHWRWLKLRGKVEVLTLFSRVS